jgi:SMC interacting uncharacterized protein involved in chromosome segregation
MAINTLQIANRLKAAEREGRTAEEIALVFGEIEEERFARLVTREQLEHELEKLRAELRAEFAAVRAEIGDARAEANTEFEKVRAETRAEFDKMRLEMDKLRVELTHVLTLRLGGMIVAAAAVLGSLNAFPLNQAHIPPM